MKKKKIRNRKGSFMVEPKDYRCSLSKLALERKNDYLVAVTMRDKDAREIKSAMFYPDASCVLLVTVLKVSGSEGMAALSSLGILIPYYICLNLLRGKLKRRLSFSIEK